MYVDNAAMQLVKNPGYFDVILTGNLFGDILSDPGEYVHWIDWVARKCLVGITKVFIWNLWYV